MNVLAIDHGSKRVGLAVGSTETGTAAPLKILHHGGDAALIEDIKAVIKKGMVLAIEPMVTEGSWEVELAKDRWTILTEDRKLAAHWELTLAVTADGYEILTPLPV